MQPDHNDMDKKLKQLENQSLPDLSKMDEHWRSMKDSLQPKDALPKERTSKRAFRWIVAASLAGLLFFVSYRFIFNNNNNDKNATAESKPSTTINNISKDTVPSINLVPGKESSVILGIDTMRFIPQKQKSKPSTIKFKGKNSDGKEIELIAVPVNDTINKKPDADKKKIIQDFFAELEKEQQSFLINNKKDTVIWGKEGTALLIPAHALGGSSEVTITMKEYYSYQDIITNQLTTCSDNRLLVSGGMLHLSATINGKEAAIQPNKSIRWFMPDTSKSSMQNMQLFNGEKRGASLIVSELLDTAAIDFSTGNINWVPQQNFFTGNYFYTYVRVLDLRDQPIKSRMTKSGKVGKFYIAPDANISKKELEDYFITKRGYSRVIIRKKSDVRRIGFLFGRRYRLSNQAIGDSAWVDLSTARRYNFAFSDTVVTTNPVRGWYDFDVYYGKKPVSRFDTAFSKQNLNNLANKFSVDIRTLGWVNCDQFLRDSRPKIDYVVKLSDPARDYYTVLVFDRIKSMMNGFSRGDQVTFSNLPQGEPVTIISIGVKEGKPVAAMHKTLLSATTFNGLKFEETTPAEFKEKTGTMDKP